MPPLISQPISQPNWKFSRLSSIDHERFVSMRIPSSVAAIIDVERVRPGQQADVRHPDHRDPVEAVGPDRAAGALDAGEGRRVAAAQRADPDARP